jgi:uncharacterized protein YecE (DUF72 family)
VYIRWHGVSNWYWYNYTEDDLKWWAKEIKKLNCDVYGYFNNDVQCYAVQNCERLKELV